MVTTFIVGLVVGLFIGWLRLRVVAKNLNTITGQSNELREALGKATAQQMALTARLAAANVALAKDQHGCEFLTTKNFAS